MDLDTVGTAVGGGRMALLALVLLALEAVALAAYHRLTGRGPAPGRLLSDQLAGAALLAALYCAWSGRAWYWVLLWLALSLPAHLLDLRLRWRTGG